MISILDYKDRVNSNCGWTKAFADAIKELRDSQGGTLLVPAGEYRTFPIRLYSNINLQLEAGSRLEFIEDKQGYELIAAEFEGERLRMHSPCIYAKDANNVSITGMGILNGNGSYWWERKDDLEAARPYLIYLENCHRVKIHDIKLMNSPVWTIHPIYCEDVEITGVSIKNPMNSPNTDGINPDSCRNVRIADCLIDVGDDCITLKAGTEESVKKIACENISITNCNLLHGHGGVVIGSEMSGGVRNVTISNCVFQDTDRGVRVKTRRGRGGVMERITISNLIMDNVICPFTFNMYYRCGAKGMAYKSKELQPVGVGTPMIRQIQIQNVMVNNANAAAGFFYGLPEQPIEDVLISDCIIHMNPKAIPGEPAMLEDMEPMCGKGILLKYTRNVELRNISLYYKDGEKVESSAIVEKME